MRVRERLAHAWGGVRTAVTGRPAYSVRFAGARMSRLVKEWFATLEDLNQVLRCDLPTLRARARSLVEDNGEAAGLLLDFEADIVGASGARLQFRAKRPRGSLLEEINDRVEYAFADWARREHCTLPGYESFASLQRLMLRTVITDGEFFALRVRDPNLKYGYALQPLDADQVDETENHPAGQTLGGRVRGQVVLGVEVDRDGRPVSYAVWDRHPTLAGRVKRWVPASDMLHVFKRVRAGQVRGVPWFAPALITWKLGDRATEAELYQAMLAAAQGGFFVNKDGSVAYEQPKDKDGKPIPLEMMAEPGLSRALPPGFEWQPWEPKHPTANFAGFMKVIKRTIARTFGRGYASLTGDLTEVNFSSMRTDRVREIQQNRVHQRALLVEQFCDVVFVDWLPMANLTGQLGRVEVRPEDVSRFTTWMCTGFPWIDPVKDATAALMELDMGVTSPQRICADRGRDFFEIIDEIAEAREYAERKKVPLSAVPLAIQVTTATTDEPETNGARVLPLRSKEAA